MKNPQIQTAAGLLSTTYKKRERKNCLNHYTCLCLCRNDDLISLSIGDYSWHSTGWIGVTSSDVVVVRCCHIRLSLFNGSYSIRSSDSVDAMCTSTVCTLIVSLPLFSLEFSLDLIQCHHASSCTIKSIGSACYSSSSFSSSSSSLSDSDIGSNE